MMKHNKDCRYYEGYKPCKMHKLYKVECDDCKYYDKFDYKILIINFAAIGDVIRTTSLLKPLKKKYNNCHITWLTEKKSAEALENIDLIDNLLIFDIESSLRLQIEKFDLH